MFGLMHALLLPIPDVARREGWWFFFLFWQLMLSSDNAEQEEHLNSYTSKPVEVGLAYQSYREKRKEER